MDFPTFAELQRAARDELLANNSKLTADAVDLPGTDAYAIIAAMAAVGDELSALLARLEAASLLASATGTDLDRLALDRYGVARKAAAPAVGEASFKVTPAAVANLLIPANTVLETSDGLQYLTTADRTLLASTTTITAPIRATTAGLSSQAASATITNITTPVPNAPASLEVTNPAATFGGTDAETDDSLRGRALNFFLTARRGTSEAIRQGALAFPGVVSASVFEALDELGRPAGSVQLIITDQYTETFAQLSTIPPDYETQAATLAADVFAGLVDYRAAGVYVATSVAKVVIQTVVLGLNFRAGYDIDETALRARAAIVGYVNSLSPGDPFLVSEAVDALRIVPGLIVGGAEILSPPGDVITTPLEVLRTSLSSVTVSSVASEVAA